MACFRKIAVESRSLVQQLPDQIFKMTAYFVDSRNPLNRALGSVQSGHHFIETRKPLIIGKLPYRETNGALFVGLPAK